MKNWTIALLSIIIICSFTMNSSADSSDESGDENTKKAWYIGFGTGSGVGFVNTHRSKNQMVRDLVDENADVNYSYQFYFQGGIGAIINSYFNVGVELSVFYFYIVYEDHEDIFSTSLNLFNYFLVGSYYPFINGLSFKIGGGGATYNESATGTGTVSSADISIHGYGFIAGIGYDLKLGNTFNLGLHIDFAKHFYYDKGLDDTTTIAIYVSCYWF